MKMKSCFLTVSPEHSVIKLEGFDCVILITSCSIYIEEIYLNSSRYKSIVQILFIVILNFKKMIS